MELKMEPKSIIDVLGVLENLKCNTRHSWTSSGRHESVAEHSWRLSVMALLLKDEFPTVDMQKVITMCLIHDWGEAITGDIPAFLKTKDDESVEDNAAEAIIGKLPQKSEYRELFNEMKELETNEAKLWRALDMLEALIQHNEADISTWLPLEDDLNLTYGRQECEEFEYTKILRDLVREDSETKLRDR
jgi:putative hydrolase of HD superfamily